MWYSLPTAVRSKCELPNIVHIVTIYIYTLTVEGECQNGVYLLLGQLEIHHLGYNRLQLMLRAKLKYVSLSVKRIYVSLLSSRFQLQYVGKQTTAYDRR